eukprot:1147855-Pelagomonas_calceolata.AAC.3
MGIRRIAQRLKDVQAELASEISEQARMSKSITGKDNQKKMMKLNQNCYHGAHEARKVHRPKLFVSIKLNFDAQQQGLKQFAFRPDT